MKNIALKNFMQHTVCPVAAAVIWGTAFSAQSICSQYMEPFSVNAARGLIAAAVLFLVCILFRRKNSDRRSLLPGSLLCGVTLFIAGNLQQLGIGATSAGKSGFVTALYIVLVPVTGLLFKKKTGKQVWIAVAVAVVGLYFLCVAEGDFTIGSGDAALLLCAAAFTAQILSVDYFAQRVDCFALSAGMFFVSGLLSAVCSLLFEHTGLADMRMCFGSVLYIALFSSCIAYTLQIVAQKGGNPAVVSLLMSLESVFALLGGVVILNEKMSPRELVGCGIMAAAIVIAQIPEKKKRG